MTAITPELGPLRCWAEIDLEALRDNARRCRELAGIRGDEPSSGPAPEIMAIVKADAYGHGLERVAATLADRVDWFGVANVREAARARGAAGVDVPILILSPPTPGEVPAIVEGGFSISISSVEEVRRFDEAARIGNTKARLHAVADTGMGRMGALPENFASLVGAVRSADHCELEGVETHFPSADEDAGFTRTQIGAFAELIEDLALPGGCRVHLGNSAGLLAFQRETPFANLSRPGLAIYGISPIPDLVAGLRPTLQLKTRVTLVREIPAGTSISYGRTFISDHPMRVATLGVGYGDGYPRHLSGRGADVLLRGRRCPLLGRVTMDQVVVDVSHLEKAPDPGEEAILIGASGEERITVEELASRAGTIPWEILTGITSRVERVDSA